jgi:hypothetical protein
VAISARLRRTPLQWFLYAVGGVALAVSAAFGGWNTVSHEKATAQVGVVNPGKPWNVKVVTARLLGGSDLEPAVYLKNKEDHWLVVIAEVEIVDDHSHIDVDRILRVPNAMGILESGFGTSYQNAADVLLARDGTRVESLHPGMTERVAYLWEQEPGAVPTRVDVDIVGMTWRKNSLTDSYEWLDEAVRASLTVPVEDKRNG